MYSVLDASNCPHHLCLIVYRIPTGFTHNVKKHGNSKSATPFHPTWTSTKQRIKEECLVEGPKAIVSSNLVELLEQLAQVSSHGMRNKFPISNEK